MSSLLFSWPGLLVFFELFLASHLRRCVEEAEARLIPILYEEPHFLLVNKPAGLLTQAVESIESLETRLIEQIRIRDSHSGTPFVGLPHRLDRGTSGVVLIARNQRALGRLGDQFHHRLVQKFYLAWVEGSLSSSEKWSDWIRKIPDQPMAEVVAEGAEGAKLAEMLVQPVCNSEGQALVLVKLLTGRMHQIRLQFASRCMPVIGDTQYGSSVLLSEDPDVRMRPLGLHALRLEFRHPQTAVPMSATAPLPIYWSSNQEIANVANELTSASRSQSRVGWSWPVTF